MKKINFISTFEKYGKEFSGRKSNTLRHSKFFDKAMSSTHIVIRKGYTKTFFIRKITDVTLWRGMCIISWNSNEKNKNKCMG